MAEIAPAVDVSWHPERNATDAYLRAGARPVCVQMGADPEVYRPSGTAARRPAACFVGQRYADRDEWAAAVLDAGLPLHLYGSGWGAAPSPGPAAGDEPRTYLGRTRPQPGSASSYVRTAVNEIRMSGLVAGSQRLAHRWSRRAASKAMQETLKAGARGRASDVAEVFGQYALVLNFSNVWADGRPGSALVPHVRLRDFEAPMSRACYLTGHTDEIEAFYEVGREIDTYRTPAELVDKVRFYLGHPAAAEAKIGRAHV